MSKFRDVAALIAIKVCGGQNPYVVSQTRDLIESIISDCIKPLEFNDRTNGRVKWRQAVTAFGRVVVYEKAWNCGDLASGYCEGFEDGERRARCWYEEQIEELFKG